MVRILTDTSSMYTVAQGAEMGVTVVPLTLTIAGKSYREIEEISYAEFKKLIDEGHIPASSQPAVGEVMEVYETATAENPVLHITLADGMSGAYQSAMGIRETMENKEHITVFHSGTLCTPQWVMVRVAKEMADKGHTVEEILKVLNEIKDDDKSYMIPQDFDYLRRGGRLAPAAAKVGSMLKLTPVMTLSADDRQIEKAGMTRGLPKAIDKVAEGFKNHGVTGEKHMITVAHSSCLEDAQLAIEKLSAAFPDCKITLFELTPVLTTQSGPRCVSIQSMMDPDKAKLF